MKKALPKAKRSKILMIGGIAAGTALAGGLAWLIVSNKGKQLVEVAQIALKNTAANFLAQQLVRHTNLPADDALTGAGVVVG